MGMTRSKLVKPQIPAIAPQVKIHFHDQPRDFDLTAAFHALLVKFTLLVLSTRISSEFCASVKMWHFGIKYANLTFFEKNLKNRSCRAQKVIK